MQRASFIEFGPAIGASGTRHVAGYGEFALANTAENCGLIALMERPLPRGMVRDFFMTSVAREIPAAAHKLEGDDVFRGSIVDATCLIVDDRAVDVGSAV